MKIIFALLISALSLDAFALPIAPFDALEKSKLKNIAGSVEALNYDFEGIVKLSNCSGALVAFSGQPLNSKAWVMTNGHCIQKPGGYLNPGEVWVNRPLSREMKIFDRSLKLHNIRSTKILYATMTNTDLAFYELTESYEDIYNKIQVRPFLMDARHPLLGQSIDIVSGYWDRGYSCSIDGFVFKLKEADWIWLNSIRYAPGCNTIGGTSGSPLIARGERRVVGVNNTSNNDGKTCTLHNPCEVDERGGTRVAKGISYGQQTYNVYPCLTPNFKINLLRSGCELPR